MGEDAGPGRSAVGQTQDPEQIREQIEATREELGDTVEALAAKSDVKAQAKRKVEDTKARLAGKQEEILGKAKEASPDDAVSAASSAAQKARENPLPVAVAGAFALGFLAGRLTKD
jgi:ElaB/YqjD/DUF883 family membrane-anchored ribosome-binding protein